MVDMETIFVQFAVFSLSLVCSNGQRSTSDWGSTRFGQRGFGDDRGIGRGMYGGFGPNQMRPEFGQRGQDGLDRDLFGNRDQNEMGQRGIGRNQPEDPGRGIPTPSQPPVRQDPVGQYPGTRQGQIPAQPQPPPPTQPPQDLDQSESPQDPDQMAEEQGMGQPGQSQPPVRPGLEQGQDPRQRGFPAPAQPSMTQDPSGIGQVQGRGTQRSASPQPTIPNQGEETMGQSPGQNGGIERGREGRSREGSMPVPQQPPLRRNPNPMGQERRVPLGESGRNGPTTSRNPGDEMGRPRMPPQTSPGTTESQDRNGFGEGDIDEPEERVSRPPRFSK